MKLLRETWILAAICVADTAFTLYLLAHGLANEGNPLLARLLLYGIPCFLAGKLLLTLVPLTLFEWCAKRRRQFTRTAMGFCIILYLVIYGLCAWNEVCRYWGERRQLHKHAEINLFQSYARRSSP